MSQRTPCSRMLPSVIGGPSGRLGVMWHAWAMHGELALPIGQLARENRYGHRDATMTLVAYRHGLRASELVALRWDSVDFAHGRLHVNRAKNGSPAVHPLAGRELRALRRLQQRPASPFIFTSERGAPFTTGGFRKLVARLGVAAAFEFPVHPHMLRHACGFALANKGVDTAACKPTSGTRTLPTRYTELVPGIRVE
jgi:integrase